MRDELLHLFLSLIVYIKQRNECEKTVIGNDIEKKRKKKKGKTYWTTGSTNRSEGKAKIIVLSY